MLALQLACSRARGGLLDTCSLDACSLDTCSLDASSLDASSLAALVLDGSWQLFAVRLVCGARALVDAAGSTPTLRAARVRHSYWVADWDDSLASAARRSSLAAGHTACRLSATADTAPPASLGSGGGDLPDALASGGAARPASLGPRRFSKASGAPQVAYVMPCMRRIFSDMCTW